MTQENAGETLVGTVHFQFVQGLPDPETGLVPVQVDVQASFTLPVTRMVGSVSLIQLSSEAEPGREETTIIPFTCILDRTPPGSDDPVMLQANTLYTESLPPQPASPGRYWILYGAIALGVENQTGIPKPNLTIKGPKEYTVTREV